MLSFNSLSKPSYRVPWVVILASLRTFSSVRATNITKCYNILGIPRDSDQETVRVAFIELVKRFHPDSQSEEADATKFNEIEIAYRTLQAEFSKKRFKPDESEGEYGLYYKEKPSDCVEQDIKHTAPQHRQYLANDGYGIGTPFQREKQYSQHRASKAAERVTEYKVSRIANQNSTSLQKRQEKSKVRDIRTGFGMDRLVEDLIQESMSRGDFDNLGGTGKPLSGRSSHNPYVDFVTHKMNEVLIDNGFVPQWITLQKEIREHRDHIRENLRKIRSKIGDIPLTLSDHQYWKSALERFENDVNYLNSKIDFYNLVVPVLNKQMTHFSLSKEAEDALKEPCRTLPKSDDVDAHRVAPNENSSWISIINSYFRK